MRVPQLLHGTADTNVDGILQNGLHGNAGVRSPPTCATGEGAAPQAVGGG